MANTILIKNLYNSAGVPTHGAGLKIAELAVNTTNTTGGNRGHIFMGVTAEGSTDLASGTNTASAYNADQTAGIVWVGAPILNEDDMASDDDTKLATQQSIKAYVDSQAGGGMSAFILEDDDGTEVSVSNAEEVKFIGSGITTNWTDVSDGSDGDPFDMTFTVDAAQTGITSLLAPDIKIGEDDQTKSDFERANEIHFYADNAEQVYVSDGVFGPQTDSDVDLGASGVAFKTLYIDAINLGGTAISSTAAELNILDGVTSTAAELNILDGVTSTAAEINLIDGGTARGTDAVASGDGLLVNDGGTMKMTNVDTVSTYFASHTVGG